MPQQSADEAHRLPAAGFVVQLPTSRMRQRGIRLLSILQHLAGSLLQSPGLSPDGSQQLFGELQELSPPDLQIWPGSRQAVAFSVQRPNSSVSFVLSHWVVDCHPQQSLWLRQISEIGRQPEAF